MSSKFTRRRFLRVLGAGTACLTLTGAEGCEVLGRDTKLKSLHTPRVSPLRVPKVRLLPSVSPAPLNGVVLPLTSRPKPACRRSDQADARHRLWLHLGRS
jgi:hypothetical protein